MKLVLALWEPSAGGLLSPDLHASLASAGATRLQVNLDDEHIPETVLRLQHFAEPLTGVVSVWTDGPAQDVLDVVGPHAQRLAGWHVDERVPLLAPASPDGERLDGLAQVAFLRRPADLPYDDWLAHWHGPHTQIAMETQATFGYVQNRVVAPLTHDTPTDGKLAVDAIVEELFPPQAMHDIHAFYGSDSDEDLGRRMATLMDSVATLGADRDLDVVATSRYVFELAPH